MPSLLLAVSSCLDAIKVGTQISRPNVEHQQMSWSRFACTLPGLPKAKAAQREWPDRMRSMRLWMGFPELKKLRWNWIAMSSSSHTIPIEFPRQRFLLPVTSPDFRQLLCRMCKLVMPTTLLFRQVSLRHLRSCLLYTSPSPRDQRGSRMPSSA